MSLPAATSPLAFSADVARVFFDDRHRALANSLEPIARAVAEIHEPRPIAEAMGREGLYRHLVPEKLGGAAAGKPESAAFIDVRSLVTIREALGQTSPTADSIFAVQGLGSYPIALAGSGDQTARYLPGVLDGTRIGAFALTEPEAGSDVASLRTRATKTGAEWILEGDKTLISNVGIADHYVVFARAAGEGIDEKKSITAFVVDARAPGVEETRLATSSPHPLGAIAFRGARVADSARLGEIGRGMSLALATLDAFRISVGAAANGMATRALAETIARVSTRRQFGAPLSEQQMVKAYVAEMATDLDAARLLVARAAHARDTEDRRVTTEAAMAKMFATEAAQTIIDKAVQLHGGMGVLMGTAVEALYRDIRPLRIYEGTTEIQKLVISRALLPAG
jgi:acyl-CoA dehydrogenase